MDKYCLTITIESLKKTNESLRTLGIKLSGTRKLTVAEARLLHCCRVCKKKITNGALRLNYGKEFAHESCL